MTKSPIEQAREYKKSPIAAAKEVAHYLDAGLAEHIRARTVRDLIEYAESLEREKSELLTDRILDRSEIKRLKTMYEE